MTTTTRNLLCAFSVSLLLAGCAGNAVQQNAAADAAAPRVSQRDETVAMSATGEQLICRYEERTGTNFKKKRCMTQEQWEITSSNQRRTVDEYSRQSSERSGQMNPGGGTVGPARL